MPEKEFFIEGNLVSDQPRADELCYVPVFMSKLGKEDVWQIGSALMKEYYVVYDMTPYDERNEKYL